MEKPTIYLSIDIETDGGNVLVNNMLSLGISALSVDGQEVCNFYENFNELDGHIADKSCMENFWAKNPEALEKTKVDKKDVFVIMKNLSKVLTYLDKEYTIKFVAMPSCFDWQFFKSYYEFAKHIDPTITYDIGFKCICFSTLMDCYRKQKNLSDRDYFFFKKSLCDIDSSKCHDAAYDARVQGIMFTKLIKLMNISF
jgi:hypothetical protein